MKKNINRIVNHANRMARISYSLIILIMLIIGGVWIYAIMAKDDLSTFNIWLNPTKPTTISALILITPLVLLFQMFFTTWLPGNLFKKMQKFGYAMPQDDVKSQLRKATTILLSALFLGLFIIGISAYVTFFYETNIFDANNNALKPFNIFVLKEANIATTTETILFSVLVFSQMGIVLAMLFIISTLVTINAFKKNEVLVWDGNEILTKLEHKYVSNGGVLENYVPPKMKISSQDRKELNYKLKRLKNLEKRQKTESKRIKQLEAEKIREIKKFLKDESPYISKAKKAQRFDLKEDREARRHVERMSDELKKENKISHKIKEKEMKQNIRSINQQAKIRDRELKIASRLREKEQNDRISIFKNEKENELKMVREKIRQQNNK